MIHFDISNLEVELKNLENKTTSPDFWNDNKNSNKILTKIKTFKSKSTKYRNLERDITNLLDVIELLKIQK